MIKSLFPVYVNTVRRKTCIGYLKNSLEITVIRKNFVRFVEINSCPANPGLA